MQFIFGDDGYKYGIMYADQGTDAAQQAMKLITYSIEPNPAYDTFGYLSYGLNQGKQLYYCVQADTSISRGVYYLHGICNLDDPGLLKKDDYLNYLFADFIGQEDLEALRSDPDHFKLPTELPKREVSLDGAIPPETAAVVLSNLYAGSPVVISVGDDVYENGLVRRMIGYLFTCMPPALRRKCSFLTAVPDTGKMSVMLSVLPEGMVKNHKAISLNNPSDEYMQAAYADVVRFITGLPFNERGKMLNLIEQICFEKSATVTEAYDPRKFLKCCNALIGKDADTLCQMILTSTERAKILGSLPDDIREGIGRKYASREYTETIIDFKAFDLFAPDKFYEKNAIQLEASCLFDNSISVIRQCISDAAEKIQISYETVNAVDENTKKTVAALAGYQVSTASQGAYYPIISEELKRIESRIALYDDMLERVGRDCKTKLTKRGEAIGSGNQYLKQLCKTYLDSLAEECTKNNIVLSKAVEVQVHEVHKEYIDQLINKKTPGSTVKYDQGFINETFDRILQNIDRKQFLEAEADITVANGFPEQYHKDVAGIICTFASALYWNDKKAFRTSPLLNTIKEQDKKRCNEVFALLRDIDFQAAVYYCLYFTESYARMYANLLELVKLCSQYEEDAMEQGEFDAMCEDITAVLSKLGEKTTEEAFEKAASIQERFDSISAKVLKSKRGKKLFACIQKCWQMDQPKGKLDTKKLLKYGGIIGGGVVLAAVIVTVIVLLAKGSDGSDPAETGAGAESGVVETVVFETDAPATDPVATDAPETDAPETNAPETTAPETDAPETTAPETDAPETDAPETNASETDAPETDAPETTAVSDDGTVAN